MPTQLYIASAKGHAKLVERLLAEGDENINQPVWYAMLTSLWPSDENGATPLFAASRNGHTKVVEMLLAQDGVCVNASNLHSWTPLYI